MNNEIDTIGFEIKRVGQQSEIIWADSCIEEGSPPSRYVFRKRGEIIFELFVYAVESEPKPIVPSHDDQLHLWDTNAKRID